MEITYRKDKDNLMFWLSGELDHHNARLVCDSLDGVIEKNIFKSVIFDFKKLSFMDSTGIGVLLGRYKRIRERNATVCVKNAEGSIDKLLKLSGIYNVFIKL